MLPITNEKAEIENKLRAEMRQKLSLLGRKEMIIEVTDEMQEILDRITDGDPDESLLIHLGVEVLNQYSYKNACEEAVIKSKQSAQDARKRANTN